MVGMDWIDVAKNIDKRWAIVNMVMSLGFHKLQGIF
jgi:hypothetical protein